VHNLLWMTGNLTVQPFFSAGNRSAALFNGEIYNFRALEQTLRPGDRPYRSDGECILEAYARWGARFAQFLDGEYAIAIVDFRQEQIVAVSDAFGIKPLYVAHQARARGSFGLSSYRSALERAGHAADSIDTLAPNTIHTWQWHGPPASRTFMLTQQEPLVSYELVQHKRSHADWVAAFEGAVQKRTKSVHGVFLPLSGGYDSAAIHLALLRLRVPHVAYTVLGGADAPHASKHAAGKRGIIDERVAFAKRFHGSENLTSHEYVSFTSMQHKQVVRELARNCEPFVIHKPVYSNLQIDTPHLVQGTLVGFRNNSISRGMTSSVGLAIMCKEARKRQRPTLVMLTGTGADEIMTDYGFNGVRLSDASQWGGYWPDDAGLKRLFPWRSFYSGTQSAYLGRDERVTGTYGVEGRYPFLDAAVVQEQLSLSRHLKNKYYKAAVQLYLRDHGYPVEQCEALPIAPFMSGPGCTKVGFTAKASDKTRH
jgi:asparagine synthetase B (glutamine-hydrolysing)